MTPRLLLARVLLAVCGCRSRHPDPACCDVQRGGAAGVTRTSDDFSIVSFNVQHRPSNALIRAFRHDPVLRVADVLLLQEMESHPHEGASRAQALAQALEMEYAYAPRYGVDAGGTHGLAILSRRSLTDLEVIELPTYNLFYNRGRVIALAATVQIGGRATRLYNTHLDTRITPRERLHQLRPMLERARADAPLPTIVAGDFNSTPLSWCLRCLPIPGSGNNAKISRLMQEYGFGMAARKPKGTTRFLGFCLDWIYTRGLVIQEYGVRDDVRVSDHYPVWIRCAAPESDGSDSR